MLEVLINFGPILLVCIPYVILATPWYRLRCLRAEHPKYGIDLEAELKKYKRLHHYRDNSYKTNSYSEWRFGIINRFLQLGQDREDFLHYLNSRIQAEESKKDFLGMLLVPGMLAALPIVLGDDLPDPLRWALPYGMLFCLAMLYTYFESDLRMRIDLYKEIEDIADKDDAVLVREATAYLDRTYKSLVNNLLEHVDADDDGLTDCLRLMSLIHDNVLDGIDDCE